MESENKIDILIQNLKDEMGDIDIKVIRIQQILSDTTVTISAYHKGLLRLQMDAMKVYSDILYMRIKDLQGLNR